MWSLKAFLGSRMQETVAGRVFGNDVVMPMQDRPRGC